MINHQDTPIGFVPVRRIRRSFIDLKAIDERAAKENAAKIIADAEARAAEIIAEAFEASEKSEKSESYTEPDVTEPWDEVEPVEDEVEVKAETLAQIRKRRRAKHS